MAHEDQGGSLSIGVSEPFADDMEGHPERREGLKLVGEGVGLILLGLGALWLSFRLAGNAKAVLGAGPLFGGAMVGSGTVQAVLGRRLRWLRWVGGAVGGIVGLGAAIILLEEQFGVMF